MSGSGSGSHPGNHSECETDPGNASAEEQALREQTEEEDLLFTVQPAVPFKFIFVLSLPVEKKTMLHGFKSLTREELIGVGGT